MMRTFVLLVAFAASACGGKKAQPAAAPSPTETAPTNTEPATDSGSAGSAAANCEAAGGKCISQAAAVSCGPKSSNQGCSDGLYCCIP